MEAGRRESGGCGCLSDWEIWQRTGVDPLLPGIPVDTFSSWTFFLASVRMKIIHLCPSATKASRLRSGEKGILSSSHDARFNLPL